MIVRMGFIRFIIGFFGALIILGTLASFVGIVILGAIASGGNALFTFGLPIVLLFIGAAMVYYGFYSH